MDWPKTLNVKGFVYGVVGAKSSLKREGNATADGPGGLDHIDGLAILAEDGNVSLRQEVAQVDDGFHVAAHAGKRLADEDVEERIALSRRGVEHIDRGNRLDRAILSSTS